MSDAAAFGFGEPVALSATTGEGIVDLYTALRPRIDEITARLRRKHGLPDETEAALADVSGRPAPAKGDSESQEGDEYAVGLDDRGRPRGPLKLAIMGLPNVGKSTLLNQLLQVRQLPSLAWAWRLTFNKHKIRLEVASHISLTLSVCSAATHQCPSGWEHWTGGVGGGQGGLAVSSQTHR